MRKTILTVLATVLMGGVLAVYGGTISQSFSQRQIRDPKKLETILEDNFAEIDNRTDGTTAVDILTDDINMAGTALDSLGINKAKAVTVTGLVATVTLADIAAASTAIDTDYVQFKFFSMANDATQDLTWAYMNIVIDDASDGSEDAALELYTVIGGATVQWANVDAAGVDLGTLNLLAPEANVDGKYATVGGDASTGIMILSGGGAAATNGNTITFPTVFGTQTPIVIVGAGESTTTAPYASTINATNFLMNGEAGKAHEWVAYGTRP